MYPVVGVMCSWLTSLRVEFLVPCCQPQSRLLVASPALFLPEGKVVLGMDARGKLCCGRWCSSAGKGFSSLPCDWGERVRRKTRGNALLVFPGALEYSKEHGERSRLGLAKLWESGLTVCFWGWNVGKTCLVEL